jgi:hypothetical protein
MSHDLPYCPLFDQGGDSGMVVLGTVFDFVPHKTRHSAQTDTLGSFRTTPAASSFFASIAPCLPIF